MAALVALLALAFPSRAPAAGMITHAWMADDAISRVSDPDLQQLLILHRYEVLSGASYPDTGYAPPATYGEIPHWERFIGGYIENLRGRGECGELTNPLGPCAPQVAHLLGTAAHGMGDEMWDWMFEPLVTDHGEDPEHPLAPPELNGVIGNIEYAMDTIALADHFRWGESGFYAPPPNEMKPIYDSIGHSEVSEADLLSGFVVGNAALAAERAGGAADAPRVREQMPWSSANFPTESGGVFDTAEGVAGYYEAIWKKLKGQAPPPEVVSIHPEDREKDVPFQFHPAKTSPGPDTGGGELRIIAVLSNAVDTESVTPENFQLIGPDGARVKTERGHVVSSHSRGRRPAAHPDAEPHTAGSAAVPPLEGFPRPGPYGNGDGTHTIMFYPAEDLQPCSQYTALATTGLHDWAEIKGNEGKHLTEDVSWTFTTRSADGEPCRVIQEPGVEIPTCRGELANVFDRTGSIGAKLTGTDGPDVIAGTPGADVIRGADGDDLICGRGGEDVVSGGNGDDRILGSRGRDELRGARGDDEIHGHQGRDLVKGGAGADLVHGGLDNDRLRGNSGADELRGKTGNDAARGGSGDDTVRGGAGRDDCHGGGGQDISRSCERQKGFP